MSTSTHRAARADADTPSSGVPSVLGQVIVVIDESGSAKVSLDGVQRSGEGVDRGQLGGVLASVADAAGGPVRVEVREADGSCYADILTPQPRPRAPRGQGAAGRVRPALCAQGFAPGETVLVSVLVTRVRATLTARSAWRAHRRCRLASSS